MRYVISDIHGEYELFLKLLEKINFSSSDEMYICGDLIEKGEKSLQLLKKVMSMPNVFCILGNHEYAFLKFYHALSEECDGNFEPLLERLSEYFPGEESLLVWEMIDYLDSLPAYLERDDFICVHSGLPLDLNGFPLPLKLASIDSLVHDRRFKDPTLLHRGNKCVFFGHTHTSYICGESKILAYRRRDKAPRGDISDYYKIHLDTGCFSSGVLGCFCVETLNAYYVKK